MNRDQLLKDLTILDFMAVDLALYLNTNTDDREALEKYNQVIAEADKVRTAYEKNYGPLCSYRSAASDHKWRWAEEPWPWSEEANFDFCGRGKF